MGGMGGMGGYVGLYGGLPGAGASEADIKKQQEDMTKTVTGRATEMKGELDKRETALVTMIKERAAAQIKQMEAMVNARKEAEIARLKQQEAAMLARVDHDERTCTAQVSQTETAAQARR